MVFKVSFKETPKSHSKVVEKAGRTTTVYLKGVVKLPEFWHNMPRDIFKWIESRKKVEVYENIVDNTLTVFSSGVARCVEGDRYDTLLGERLAEARAKYNIYEFFDKLTGKLSGYYNTLLFGYRGVVDSGDGNCLAQDGVKYEKLCRRELEYQRELIMSKGNE